MAATRAATGNSKPRVFPKVETEVKTGKKRATGTKKSTTKANTSKPRTTKKSTTGAGVTKKKAEPKKKATTTKTKKEPVKVAKSPAAPAPNDAIESHNEKKRVDGESAQDEKPGLTGWIKGLALKAEGAVTGKSGKKVSAGLVV